jgi:hypothetical protein
MNDAYDDALNTAVQRWAQEIRYKSRWTVETILGTAEKLLAACEELEPYGPKARAMLAAEARLSRPMMSRLEAIGRHAAMLRRKISNLPPHVSSLYALTRLPFAQFRKAIETDLRGMSCAAIMRHFAPRPPEASHRRLMTIALPAGIVKETRHPVMMDIRAAVARIAQVHGLEIAASPKARHRKSTPLVTGDSDQRSGLRKS